MYIPKPLPTQELLNKLLIYNPDTGLLFWKTRTKYSSPKDHGRRIFNTRFAGKEAFKTVNIHGYNHGVKK